MTGTGAAELARLLAVDLGVLALAAAGLWAWAVRRRDAGLVEALWPLGTLVVALAAFIQTDGDEGRRGLLLWLTAVWAIRGGWVGWRRSSRGDGSTRLRDAVAAEAGIAAEAGRAGSGAAFGAATAAMAVAPFALLAFVVALPAQLGQAAATTIGPVGWVGAALAVAGVAVCGLADAQRAQGAGLWRRVKRPDYGGDALVGWGLWLLAVEAPAGGWTLAGPLALTFALLAWSGRLGVMRTRRG